MAELGGARPWMVVDLWWMPFGVGEKAAAWVLHWALKVVLGGGERRQRRRQAAPSGWIVVQPWGRQAAGGRRRSWQVGPSCRCLGASGAGVGLIVCWIGPLSDLGRGESKAGEKEKRKTKRPEAWVVSWANKKGREGLRWFLGLEPFFWNHTH
jgi:hypothetical protein